MKRTRSLFALPAGRAASFLPSDAESIRALELQRRLGGSPPVASEDGKALLYAVPLPAGDAEELLGRVEDIRETVGRGDGDLQVRVTGPGGFLLDAVSVFDDIDTTLLLVTVVVVAVLLLLTYRSPPVPRRARLGRRPAPDRGQPASGTGQETTIIAAADQAVDVLAAARDRGRGRGPPGRPDGRAGPGAGDRPDSPAERAAIDRLRDAVHAVEGADAVVGGQSAQNLDLARASARDRNAVIPLVLLVVLVILGLLLRAAVAPLGLIMTVILSFAAALGASALAFDHVFGFEGSDPSLPLITFIFLMSRVREGSERLGTRAGTLKGLAVTGGVITSAGIVLAATFSVLVPALTLDPGPVSGGRAGPAATARRSAARTSGAGSGGSRWGRRVAAGPLALLPVPLLRRGPVRGRRLPPGRRRDGLAAERSYVRRVLPRAAAMLCGLAFTASGYLRGRSEVGSTRARSFSSSDWSRSSSSSR